MRVDSGFASLSRLQARQAFNPVMTSGDDAENALPDIQTSPAIENLRSEPKSMGSKPQLPVGEIRDIARRAGYLDVSDADIQRAYAYGESLLTDYNA